MAIDVSRLPKGLMRKLNALRRSVGNELGEEVFEKWFENHKVTQVQAKPDPVAVKIAGALAAFEKDPKFKPGNHGYTVRRAKGKGASGFAVFKNEKPI